MNQGICSHCGEDEDYLDEYGICESCRATEYQEGEDDADS